MDSEKEVTNPEENQIDQSDIPNPLRHMASFSVSPMLLEQALTIPAGHEIVGAEWDFASRTVRLYLEGPELPEVAPGMMVPVISPTVTLTIDDEGKRYHIWDWNS